MIDADEVLRSFREYTETIANLRRTGHKGPAIMSGHEFILKYGQVFTPAPRPNSIRKMMVKQCFHNASAMAFKNKNLVYVEGVMYIPELPAPIDHAWVVEKGTDKVIDVTSDNGVWYMGVPIKRKFLFDHHNGKGQSMSLLNDWQADFYVQQQSEKKIQAMIDRSVGVW